MKAYYLLFCVIFMANFCFAENTSFVQVADTHFILDGSSYYFSGINNYYLMVYGASPETRFAVDEVMEEAAKIGITVIRTWAFNDGEQWNALQPAQGVFDEQVFQALDYVLAKANTLEIRLILPLVNNWDDYGGMNQYVDWSPTAVTHDDFYTDENCRWYFKNYINRILNRINTINGRVYKNDPTVLAWELANEPRAEEYGLIQPWIAEMSAYIRTLGAQQLIATGEEGFTGIYGTDFVTDHQNSSIDFTVCHLWPESWGFSDEEALEWVEQHFMEAHTIMQKPIIIEEFGLSRDDESTGTSKRDEFFQNIYQRVETLDAAGSNAWILYHDAYPDYDGFGIYFPADSSTIAIIEENAHDMLLKSGFRLSLILNKPHFYTNDLFTFDVRAINPLNEQTLNLFIVLDVFGNYYFWPTWRHYPPEMDFDTIALPAMDIYSQRILYEIWPGDSGAASPIILWGALLDPLTNQLVGNLDWVEFGYGYW